MRNLFAFLSSGTAAQTGADGAFDTIIAYASTAVILFGAGIAISGLINMGEGKSQQNAGKQDEGMSKLVGGGIIILIGLTLIPKLADWVKV